MGWRDTRAYGQPVASVTQVIRIFCLLLLSALFFENSRIRCLLEIWWKKSESGMNAKDTGQNGVQKRIKT